MRLEMYSHYYRKEKFVYQKNKGLRVSCSILLEYIKTTFIFSFEFWSIMLFYFGWWTQMDIHTPYFQFKLITLHRHSQKYVLEFFLVKSNSRTKAFVYFPWWMFSNLLSYWKKQKRWELSNRRRTYLVQAENSR